MFGNNWVQGVLVVYRFVPPPIVAVGLGLFVAVEST